jgi:hypothetical protein
MSQQPPALHNLLASNKPRDKALISPELFEESHILLQRLS